MHLGPGRGMQGLQGAHALTALGTGLSPGRQRGPRAGAVERDHRQIQLKWEQEQNTGKGCSRDRGTTLPGRMEGAWVMVRLCYGAKSPPREGLPTLSSPKFHARCPVTSLGVSMSSHGGRSSLRVRMKFRTKLLMAGGKRCSQLPQVLPESHGREGEHGDTRALLCSPAPQRGGITGSTHSTASQK